jgi:hypothetical protein
VLIVTAVCFVGIVMLGTQVSRVLSTVGASVGPNSGDAYPGTNAGNPGTAVGGQDSNPNGGDEAVDGGTGGGGTGDAVSASMLDAARPDLLIIKTGQITIQVGAIGPAIQKVTEQIVGLGGYASGSTRSGKGEDASASVTFRVPANRWEAALAAARGAGDDVLDEQTETADVTGDVVDLKARIRNLQATEAALQTVMTRASAIKDILEVQARLTDVQGEIEQLSSKAADLEGRAAYSTLTLNARMRPAPVIARQEARFDPGREAEGATAQLVGILQHVATVGIWVGIVWLPILVVLSILGGIGFVITRRARRTVGGDPGGGAGGAPLPEGGA